MQLFKIINAGCEVSRTKTFSVYYRQTGKGSYVMVDKIITQDETSTLQNSILTSKIGDL